MRKGGRGNPSNYSAKWERRIEKGEAKQRERSGRTGETERGRERGKGTRTGSNMATRAVYGCIVERLGPSRKVN